MQRLTPEQIDSLLMKTQMIIIENEDSKDGKLWFYDMTKKTFYLREQDFRNDDAFYNQLIQGTVRSQLRGVNKFHATKRGSTSRSLYDHYPSQVTKVFIAP